jgi:ABC-type antimicrobial peptide transport system permease subunit
MKLDDELIPNAPKAFRSRSQFRIYKSTLKLILKIKLRAISDIICVLISIGCCFSVLQCPKENFKRYNEFSFSSSYDFNCADCATSEYYYFPRDCQFAFYPKDNPIFNEAFNCSTGCLEHENCFSFDSIPDLNDFMNNHYEFYHSFIFENQNEKQIKIIGRYLTGYGAGSFYIQKQLSALHQNLMRIYGFNVSISFNITTFPYINHADYIDVERLFKDFIFDAINFSALFPCLMIVLLIFQLREKKQWLLLKSSGAFESTLWLAFFSINFVINLIIAFIFSFIFSIVSKIHIGFSLCLISYLLFSLLIQFFLYFYIPFLFKTSWNIAFIFFALILVIVSVFIWEISEDIDYQTLKILCLFSSNYC